ncbi:hypothetical protein ACW9KT_20180 [Hymenobacter sp. HD11105]
MESIICTLVEGHYHYGVAGLVNSLYNNGFRGSIYVGYRGDLPDWLSGLKKNSFSSWDGASFLQVAEGLLLHYLPVNTDFHLTNYKPFFMNELLKTFVQGVGSIAYFDPDIVIKCQWSFFENWMNCGVALVHEVANDPMPASHPIRLGWVEVLEKVNRKATKNLEHYFNAGFCGVAKRDRDFINIWCEIINAAVEHFEFNPRQFDNTHNRTYHFEANDQDALNIAAMCTFAPISEVGPDGMDFTPGGWIMSHATGSMKPWRKRFILNSLKGFGPSAADRSYWRYVNSPINVFSRNKTRYANFSMSLAAFIGRFYHRR